MNSWLKLALYSFIGIIIGSFVLGILAPNSGMDNTMSSMGNMHSGYYGQWGMNNMRMRMHYGMGAGMNQMNNGMSGGMGMDSDM